MSRPILKHIPKLSAAALLAALSAGCQLTSAVTTAVTPSPFRELPSNREGLTQQRMLEIAATFESQNRDREALGLYRSIAKSSPNNQLAREKVLALTERIKNGPPADEGMSRTPGTLLANSRARSAPALMTSHNERPPAAEVRSNAGRSSVTLPELQSVPTLADAAPVPAEPAVAVIGAMVVASGTPVEARTTGISTETPVGPTNSAAPAAIQPARLMVAPEPLPEEGTGTGYHVRIHPAPRYESRSEPAAQPRMLIEPEARPIDELTTLVVPANEPPPMVARQPTAIVMTSAHRQDLPPTPPSLATVVQAIEEQRLLEGSAPAFASLDVSIDASVNRSLDTAEEVLLQSVELPELSLTADEGNSDLAAVGIHVDPSLLQQPGLDEQYWRASRAESYSGWSLPATTLDQIAEHASPRVRQLIEILATRPELAGSALDELAATGTSATSAQPAVAWYLDHPDAAIKARAAQAAVAIGDRSPRVIESLQSMLATGESQAVQLASFLASDLGTQAEELSPSLEGLLVNGHAGVQISAAEALLRLNPDHPAAVQTLQRALRYGRPDQRWTAAAALGACTSTTHRVFVIDALTQALHDSDASVREAAALSLGGFGPAAQSAVPGLEESLQDPRTAVRSAARTALECITEQPQP